MKERSRDTFFVELSDDDLDDVVGSIHRLAGCPHKPGVCRFVLRQLLPCRGNGQFKKMRELLLFSL